MCITNSNRKSNLSDLEKSFAKVDSLIYDIEKGSINRKNHNMRQDKNIIDYFSEKRSSFKLMVRALEKYSQKTSSIK